MHSKNELFSAQHNIVLDLTSFNQIFLSSQSDYSVLLFHQFYQKMVFFEGLENSFLINIYLKGYVGVTSFR